MSIIGIGIEDYSNEWALADKCLKELTIIARIDLDINTINTIAKRKINKNKELGHK